MINSPAPTRQAALEAALQNNPIPRLTQARAISRRRLLASAVATVAGAATAGEALLTYKPWLSYSEQARLTWGTPFRSAGAVSSQILEMIRYATLAPSGHNAQPWKFAVIQKGICIYPDYSRRLPAVDPVDRELWISLGCALENAVIAATSAGYTAEVTYPEPGTEYITVKLAASLARGADPLSDAIPHRQNTRSLYDGRRVPQSDINKIYAGGGTANVFLTVLSGNAEKEAIIEYVKSGNLAQYDSTSFVDELVSWLRFNNSEAMRTLDGLSTRCGGNPQLPRWLGKRFVTGATANQQSAADERNIRSSSGLIAIAAAHDDKRHWIETGRLYERLALTLTTCGIKVAFVNQPVEVPSLRSQFQSYLKLGAAQPQLLLRFGYADAMPRSLRRPVDQVLASI